MKITVKRTGKTWGVFRITPQTATLLEGGFHRREHAEDAVEQYECQGHETTSGAIGSTEYCDGSCRTKPKVRECEYCGADDTHDHECYGTQSEAGEARRSDDR